MSNICLGPVYIPRDILGLWREKNHDWLELGEVHRETTLGVRVTVMPFFMGHKENVGFRMFWWRYNVRIENLTDVMIQLKARQWRIYSVAGTLETVKGKGVIGQVTKLIQTHHRDISHFSAGSVDESIIGMVHTGPT